MRRFRLNLRTLVIVNSPRVQGEANSESQESLIALLDSWLTDSPVQKGKSL
jgi:hypothetical protein